MAHHETLEAIDRYTPSQKEEKQKKEKEEKKKQEKEEKRMEKKKNEGKKKVNGAQRKSKKDEVIEVKDDTLEMRPRPQPKPIKIQKICSLTVDPSEKLDVTALEHLRSIVRTGLVVDNSKRYVCFMTL